MESDDMIHFQLSQLNEVICSLTKQQEICASLSAALSHIATELVGNITKQQYNALFGSVNILDSVSKQIHFAYTELELITDKWITGAEKSETQIPRDLPDSLF
jgi:hypothetical protein